MYSYQILFIIIFICCFFLNCMFQKIMLKIKINIFVIYAIPINMYSASNYIILV